jgi:fumarate reductase subunit D
MSLLKHNLLNEDPTADSNWKSLYKIGGAAALITAVIMPIQIIVYIAFPPPSTVFGFFTLFQDNCLLGLLALDLLLIVDQVLLVPIILALYAALRRANESFTAIALTLGIIGIAAYFSSNTAFEMLYLSNQYAVATTEAQRSMLSAAGQAMLAIYGGTSFQLSYVLQAVYGIIISAVMLQSKVFSKVTAYVGILAGVIAFGLFVPNIGIFISIFSILFYEMWYILIARRLFQLGQSI